MTIIVVINSANIINHIDIAITVLDTIYSLNIDNNLYTLDTIDIYYTRGKLIPIAITILVILI